MRILWALMAIVASWEIFPTPVKRVQDDPDPHLDAVSRSGGSDRTPQLPTRITAINGLHHVFTSPMPPRLKYGLRRI